MRRTVVVLVALAALGGCKRKEKIRVVETDESGGTLQSVVHVADPKAEPQLLQGFYNVEQNAWRWTASKFSVALRPPGGASQKGATLVLKLSVPDPVIQKLKAVSISAAIGGTQLSPETYTQSGEFTYTRDIDARLLAGEAVNIDFALDKFLAPGEADQRELGVVVTTIGLEAK